MSLVITTLCTVMTPGEDGQVIITVSRQDTTMNPRPGDMEAEQAIARDQIARQMDDTRDAAMERVQQWAEAAT